MKYFSCLFARGLRGEFGYNNNLPWKIKEDMRMFSQLTTGGTVIMGRRTFESMGSKPLKNRLNVVITQEIKRSDHQDVKFCSSLDAALEISQGATFVIGGVRLLQEAFQHPSLERIYETRVYADDLNADVWFTEKIPSSFESVEVITLVPGCDRHEYQRRTGERQYLNLMKELVEKDDVRGDRTGVGTYSTFGVFWSFDLKEGFPLMTTKRVFFRGVFEELMWFLRGQTDSKILEEKGVFIWQGNTRREYLDKVGLMDLPEGEIGKGYGFQWRKFGGDDQGEGGVDQIVEVIRLLKEEPESRRIILTAWNPRDLKKMALPPCHVMAQFYVKNRELSCLMVMRSCDLFLGFPFNVASYALLTHLLAEECGYEVGELKCSLGDAHVYVNHKTAVLEQVGRAVRRFPKLKIIQKKVLTEYQFEDIVLENYNPHAAIKAEMAV